MMHREAETPRGIEAVQSQLDALKKRTAALETAHAKCEARIRDLHDQNTSLVQLTVASQLLANSIEREDVLCAIEEVVVNMIGSEELAIFDLDSDGQSLKIARLRGIRPTSPRLVLATGAIHRGGQRSNAHRVRTASARRQRRRWLDGRHSAQGRAQCDGNRGDLPAARAKTRIDPTDHDLFDVLSLPGSDARCTPRHSGRCARLCGPRESPRDPSQLFTRSLRERFPGTDEVTPCSQG